MTAVWFGSVSTMCRRRASSGAHTHHAGCGKTTQIPQFLLDDALRWMRRRDVTRTMVNTAVDNHAALSLYATTGFERQPGSLLILERALR